MLEIRHLYKEYDDIIIDDLNYTFSSKGMYVILGESGCGKSTLLHILGGLDDKYQGEVLINHQDIQKCKHYRRKYISFLFQNYNLIENMTVKDNYQIVRYLKKCLSLKKEKHLIDDLGLNDLKKRYLSKVSGGQKQRIALARSMLSQSPIILCDEPTGSLDLNNSKMIFKMLYDLSKQALVIVITHDQYLAYQYHDVLLKLEHGKFKTLDKKELHLYQLTHEKLRKKSYIHLIYQYFKSSFRLNTMMTFLVSLSLICILATFTLSSSTRMQLKKQINQLIPTTQIKVTKKNNDFFSIDDLKKLQTHTITQRYLENSQVEMLGVSMLSQYQEQKTIYIGDCTQKITSNMLKKGRLYRNNKEIVLSQSTYQHLKRLAHQNLLNKEIYIHYQYYNQLKSIKVKIVGVSQENTLLDTLYFKEMANMDHINELFQLRRGNIALVFINQDKDIHQLVKEYNELNFKKTNQQITRTIDQQINKLELILLCFSLLAIVSCCFLIGEILYLIVIKKEHYFSILRSLGASLLQVMLLVYFQGLIIMNVAFINAYLFLQITSESLNEMISHSLGQSLHLLVLDKKSLIIVYAVAFLLTFISSTIPALKIKKMNIIDGLKGK